MFHVSIEIEIFSFRLSVDNSTMEPSIPEHNWNEAEAETLDILFHSIRLLGNYFSTTWCGFLTSEN